MPEVKAPKKKRYSKEVHAMYDLKIAQKLFAKDWQTMQGILHVCQTTGLEFAGVSAILDILVAKKLIKLT